MSALVFELPLPTNMANGRLHWAVKNKKRQAYLNDCDVINWAIFRRCFTPFENATATITMRVARLHDHDNAFARCKWAIDWLVSRGVIADDSPKCLSYSGLPTQTIDRKNPGITITLERLT